MEAVYNFLQKSTMFLRASASQDSLKNDVQRLNEFLERANSTVLAAQLMSHDAGVTAMELLYTSPYATVPYCPRLALISPSLAW